MKSDIKRGWIWLGIFYLAMLCFGFVWFIAQVTQEDQATLDRLAPICYFSRNVSPHVIQKDYVDCSGFKK